MAWSVAITPQDAIAKFLLPVELSSPRRPSPVDDRMGGCRDPEEPHRTQVMPHRENEKSQRQMIGEDVNEGEASAG